MMVTTESDFSDEDLQYIATYELGKPLYVYRLKASYIRFLRGVGLFIFYAGIAGLIFTISVTLYKGIQYIDPFRAADIFVSLFGSLYALFQGGVLYRILVQQTTSTCIIVCEDGLLQTTKIFKTNHAKVVQWNNILTIKKAIIGQNYSITYHDDRRFNHLTLYSSYENLNELVALIKEYRDAYTH